MPNLAPAALLFGPAYLRSPVLQKLSDVEGYPWRELYVAPLQGQERLYCNTRDILDLLHVLCPYYANGLTEVELHDWITSVERMAAVNRLVSQMLPGLRNPRAAWALRKLAAAQDTTPRTLLHTEIFPVVAFLAIREAATPQRMRIRQQWLTDEHGKLLAVPPVFAPIPPAIFLRWFFSQVYAAAQAGLLGKEYPRPVSKAARLVFYEAEDLNYLVKPESPSAQESAMLATLLEDDEEEPAARLRPLLDVASPREQEMLTLLEQGLSRNEASRVMGISRSTVDVLFYRLHKKASNQ